MLWEQKADGLWEGLTPNYVRVYTAADAALENRILPTRLTGLHADGMLGEYWSRLPDERNEPPVYRPLRRRLDRRDGGDHLPHLGRAGPHDRPARTTSSSSSATTTRRRDSWSSRSPRRRSPVFALLVIIIEFAPDDEPRELRVEQAGATTIIPADALRMRLEEALLSAART